jgi:hypothetical protein
MLAIFTIAGGQKTSQKHARRRESGIGTLLADKSVFDWTRRTSAMYDRDFFTSKLGIAALVSIAAMVTFNVYTLTNQYGMTTEQVVVVAPLAVELA